MKNLKSLLVAFMLLCSAATYAQDLDSKGFTVQVYLGMYTENEELKSYDVNEVYNISLTDKYLVHNILSAEGVVTNSQLYKISNIERTTLEGSPTFKFDATSGLSGNVYKYEVSFTADSGATVSRTQPDGGFEVFLGISVIFKTFIQ